LNKNKLFYALLFKKRLRNAFIYPEIRFIITKSIESEKMKKTWAIIFSAIIAVSALSLVASASAMPFMNWRYNKMIGPVGRPVQQSFVRVDGVINDWSSTKVIGTVEAQSRTVVLNNTNTRQGASVAAIWTTNLTRPISGLREKQNFTYTFYTARLVNVNVSSLNVTGYSLFMNGTWNVFKVNQNLTINTDATGNIIDFNRTQNAVAIATGAEGNFTIPNGSTTFTIDITGLNNLTGTVHFQRITSKMFNPFIINNDGGTTTVTKADVSTVVSSYGASPGWGHYDQRMDYNFNGKIDITDLATAAANVNI
jgi:hypothetical protein